MRSTPASAQRLAEGAIHDRLHFLLHGRKDARIAHNFHPPHRIGHESVDRHDRKDGGDRARRIDAVQRDRSAAQRVVCGRRRGIVGVDDRKRVAVPHRPQYIKQFGVEHWINPDKHDEYLLDWLGPC